MKNKIMIAIADGAPSSTKTEGTLIVHTHATIFGIKKWK